MCPNVSAPPDPDMLTLLFEHMRMYDKRGDYVIEMLETAERLLRQPEPYPRHAEVAAYCIRQAVVEIFNDKNDDRVRLSSIATRVINAKRCAISATGTSNGDLQILFNAVDDMDDFLKSKNEHHLATTLQLKTGLDPIHGDYSILKTYRKLVKDLNKIMHKVTKIQSVSNTVHIYNRAIEVLAKMLLPRV